MSPGCLGRRLEEAIECALLRREPDACAGDATAVHGGAPPALRASPPGGLRSASPRTTTALCLLPRDVVELVLATQPKEWKSSSSTMARRCASSS